MSTRPYIWNTFLTPDFEGSLRWTQAQVDANFKSMLATGIDTVVVQWSADAPYGDCYYGGSKRWASNWTLLDKIMDAAGRLGVKVWVGLANNNTYPDHLTDPDWWTQNKNDCIATAQEIYARFGADAIEGWYIVHEISATLNSAGLDTVKGYFDSLCTYLHANLGGKRVMCSPTFWEDKRQSPPLGAREVAQRFRYVMGATDVINVQDGGGWGVMNHSDLVEYFTALRDELAGTGTELWQNADIFDAVYGFASSPSELNDRLAKIDPLVTGHGSYSFTTQLWPERLGNDYFWAARRLHASRWRPELNAPARMVQPASVSASAETLPYEGAASLIDGYMWHRWVAPSATPTVTFDFTAPVALQKYILGSTYDHPERDPRDWRLEGSNDNAKWTPLDSRTGETFASRKMFKAYSFENTTVYRYYRLKVLDNNGTDDVTHLAVVAFHQTAVTSNPPKKPPKPKAPSVTEKWYPPGTTVTVSPSRTDGGGIVVRISQT